MVSWSSGRDPAWALHTLRDQGYDVRGVFTTVTAASGRLSKHAAPIWVLEQQADRLGLPLC